MCLTSDTFCVDLGLVLSSLAVCLRLAGEVLGCRMHVDAETFVEQGFDVPSRDVFQEVQAMAGPFGLILSVCSCRSGRLWFGRHNYITVPVRALQ